MPEFGKLSQQEIERLKKRRPPAIDLSQYLSYLDTLKSGEWGSVTPEASESPRAIKRRLTMASKAKGIGIRYKKVEDNRIVFEVK